MGNKIRLNEGDLTRLVSGTVRKIFEEYDSIGMRPEIYDKLQDMKDLMGAEELLDAIAGKMDHRRLYEILIEIENEANIGLDDEEDFEMAEE